MSAQKIAFILGSGQIALDAFHRVRTEYSDTVAVVLSGADFSNKDLNIRKDEMLRSKPEKIGAIFSFLKQHKVTHIVMIGAIERPNILQLRPDIEGYKFLFKNILTFLKGGDDALLKALKKYSVQQNIEVLGVHQIWTDTIARKEDSCNLGQFDLYFQTVKLAWGIAKQHGADDLGQAVCVFEDGHNGHEIFKEQKTGTNVLIKNAAKESTLKGGLLVKLSKPQQDLSLDMPTIGLTTFKELKKYGYKGAVIEADKTILHDKEQITLFCVEHDMFLAVLSEDEVNTL